MNFKQLGDLMKSLEDLNPTLSMNDWNGILVVARH